jgi:hypothetical protein
MRDPAHPPSLSYHLPIPSLLRLAHSPAAYVFDSAADPRTLFILAEDTSALLSCALGALCLGCAELTGMCQHASVCHGQRDEQKIMYLHF